MSRRLLAVSSGVSVFLFSSAFIPALPLSLAQVPFLCFAHFFLAAVLSAVVVSVAAWEYVPGMNAFAMAVSLVAFAWIRKVPAGAGEAAVSLLILEIFMDIVGVLGSYTTGWIADVQLVFRFKYADRPQD